MLTKMVDGKTVVLTPNEERQQRAFWDLNTKYPEYSGHCGWDGVSEPFHDMVECRKHHARLTEKAIEAAKQDLNKKIEIAQEEGNAAMHQSLLAQRKALRQHEGKDFNGYVSIEHLRSSVPEVLKPYWNK